MNLLELFKGKNVLFITHVDLDGVGCCILYKNYIEPIANYSIIEVIDRPDIEKYNFDLLKNKIDLILFTDISPVSREQYFKLCEDYKVIIIDHHATAHGFLGGNLIDYYYDDTKCGTKLFFDLIRKCVRVKKVTAQFVELVNIFDLYQTDSLLWKQAKDLSNVMYGLVEWYKQQYQTGYQKYLPFINNQLDKFYNAKQFYLNVYEQGLAKKAEEKERIYLLEAKRIMDIRKDTLGNTYIYTECLSKISWVAHLILKEMPQIDYIVIRSTFNDKNGDITPKVSIRSLETSNIDCSIIAEKYNCGGHMKAAGIEFENIDFFRKFRKGELHLI